MLMRRRLLRTAAVGGVAYAAGHHSGNKSAEQAQTDATQNAQIADVQDQQAAAQQQAPPPPATPAPSSGLTDDDLAQLKQLGQLHDSGVLTDSEFEASKQKILG